jgi:RHS repeat-associated protein
MNHFTGKERDAETGLDYFLARYYSGAQGRFISADLPLIDQRTDHPQSWNLYSYARNNPLKYVDEDGRSTHTDWSGYVVAVYNDGDLGIYRHISLDNWDGNSILPKEGSGIERMGETQWWDEFLNPEKKKILPGVRIDFGASFDDLISMLNEEARESLPGQLAQKSLPGGRFDIKSKSPFLDSKVGRLLNGKCVTLRSAGNYLAGLNAASIGIPAKQIRDTAGALQNWGALGVALHKLLGLSFGEEIPYAQRQIDLGIEAGKKIYVEDLIKRMTIGK